MVAQAGQALAWPVSDDAGIPTPVWAITNERRNSVIAFLVVIGDLCYVTSNDTETPGHHSVGRHVSRAINNPELSAFSRNGTNLPEAKPEEFKSGRI